MSLIWADCRGLFTCGGHNDPLAGFPSVKNTGHHFDHMGGQLKTAAVGTPLCNGTRHISKTRTAIIRTWGVLAILGIVERERVVARIQLRRFALRSGQQNIAAKKIWIRQV